MRDQERAMAVTLGREYQGWTQREATMLGGQRFVGSKGSRRAGRAGYGWRRQRSNQGGHGGSSACDVIGWPRTTCQAGDKRSSLRHLAA